MRKLVRRVLILGLLSAAAYAVWRRLSSSAAPDAVTWTTQPAPFPPAPVVTPAPEPTPPAVAPAPPADGPAGWIEPEDGACPVSHPVKAKLASGIFHVPGGQNYDRTKADRCYPDSAAAEADGLRAAKR